MGGRLPSLPRLPRILFAKRAKQNALRAPPYGAVIADLGTNLSAQQYKFGGKELTTANGLNEYDFGARQYYQAIPGFTSIDPMCEKYYWLSPYTYCANNPVNLVDPTGEIPSPYEAAIMSGYVYHDKHFDDYQEALGKTDWRESEFNTSIQMNMTGTFENGLQSMLFERTTDGVTEYALAFAGTNSIEDGLEDLAQLVGLAPQYTVAIKNARILSEELSGHELTFVGQSLGGGLSAASSMATGKNAITFNRASVSALTSLFNNLGDVSNVRDYVVMNQNTATGIIKEEPLTRVQRNLSIQAKGTCYPIFVKNMRHIDTHAIYTVFKALEPQKK